MSYWELFCSLIPEAWVTGAALVALGMDLGAMRHRPGRRRMVWGAVVVTVGCFIAGGWLLFTHPTGRWYDGMLVLDDLGRLMKLLILLLTVLTAWLTTDSDFTDHVGEYFLMLLTATVGMMFLVSTEHLLMIFVSLELLSLPLYIMTGFDKRSPQSAEAGLKYFLVGGVAAAFLLFGLSLVYGISGELDLRRVAHAIGGRAWDPLLVGALIMVVAGLGFKVAAVPFHLWAPDAYQGAPIPSAAFVASGSKVASFFVLARVMMVGFNGLEGHGGYGEMVGGWVPVLTAVAALSVVLGNLSALGQQSVRRLLAYSAIAQSGYILVGLLADSPDGLASVLYYSVTYALTVLGAFGVVGWVQEHTGRENLGAFAGLSQRAPLVSLSMLVFLLSLAGIPPLAGFIGKFYLFSAALAGPEKFGLLWLVILAVAMSAVSLYYYLQVLKQIFVVETPATPWSVPGRSAAPLVVVFLALTVLLLGCLPGWLLDLFLPALKSAGI